MEGGSAAVHVKAASLQGVVLFKDLDIGILQAVRGLRMIIA